MRTIAITIGLTAAIFMCGFYCTKIDYSNPLDNRGTKYAGDSAVADDNGDGIPNLYDPTWKGITKTYPKIVFTGPDTVVIAKDDPQHVWTRSDSAVTATDSLWGEKGKLWGNLTDSIKRSGNVFTSVCSTFTVVYTVRNLIDSQSSRSRTVIVDCAPPDIVLKGDNPLHLRMGTPYTEPGADATDNIDGNLTSKIAITGTVDISRDGVDTITYSVTDNVGNVGTQQRQVIVYTVVVADTVKPVITLVGSNPLTIQQNTVFTDPGVTVVDNIDGPISADKVTKTITTATGGAADFATFASVKGSYIVSYTVSDAAKNKAIATRTVIVQGINTGKDSTPPVITFKVCSECTTKVGTAWTEPGYTAWDDHDGDVSGKVVPPTQTPNTNVPGITILRYTVADSAGNSATYSRTVTVVGISTDTTRPVITLDGAVRCTVSVGKTFTDPGYSAQDNADGVIAKDKIGRAIKNSAGVAADFTTFTNTVGSYTITYTVSDASGNAANPALRYVVVKDTVIDTTVNGDLLKKYGVPLATALPTINGSYKGGATTEGTGAPNVSSITIFTLNWDLPNKGLYQFSLNFTAAPYYTNLSPTHTFGAASPGFTLTGSGITGLDGDYYIVASATQCVWVKKDGKFAVIFK